MNEFAKLTKKKEGMHQKKNWQENFNHTSPMLLQHVHETQLQFPFLLFEKGVHKRKTDRIISESWKVPKESPYPTTKHTTDTGNQGSRNI